MNQPNTTNTDSLEIKFKLAHAWQLKGNLERSFVGYKEILDIQPDYVPAYQELGNLMLKQKRIDKAFEYYEKALSIDADATDLSYYYAYLGLPKKKPEPKEALALKENAQGKINLSNQKIFPFHRSGWDFAINALTPLHNSQGVLFDGFLENTFAWRHRHEGFRPTRILEKMKRDGTFDELATSEEKGIIPYTQPWIGFLHNPPRIPEWLHYQESLQQIFAKDIWQKSLNSCLGLFALSEYHAQWLREQTGKPVSALIHPTEIPEIQFDFDKFIQNPQKKIVQIGWWLRKLNAIYQLPIACKNPLNYEKIKLIPQFFGQASEYIQMLTEREKKHFQIEIQDDFLQNTKKMQRLSNDEYDTLLSQNIAFIDLYDSSANNAVIECIARATPLLINPLPAVIEYLGKDYPLYFENLSEAAEKALNPSLIRAAHNYLKKCETRHKISAEYFRTTFEESEVYQSIAHHL